MLNSAKLPKQFWGEAVNTACYTQNRSITVKRHGKTTYVVFRGRFPYISYSHVFGCPMHIHNYRDHLIKFDEKADDGFFLGYSPMTKAFKVFNIRRQEMEEIIHVTFSEDDEAISQSSTEGDAINFNENISFLNDEFLEPRSKVTQCLGNIEYFPYYIPAYENTTPSDSPFLQDSVSSKEPPEFTVADDHLAPNELDQPKSMMFNPLQSFHPQLKEPFNLIFLKTDEVESGLISSAHECLYVNFLSEMEPNKLIEALEEEGWIIAMQEELNHFKRNKMDVNSAFLNAKILEEVYIKQPLGFQQAPRAWYETLSKFLIQHKFVRDYAGCNLDRKSTSGGCQILGGKLVCWSAKKQSYVAMSSAEAKYVAPAGCCAQVLWIKSQLADYDVLYDNVPIFCDNTSAIAISNNPVLHSRTKHIDIRYHFIRDHILKGDIKLHFVPTDLQLADIFTKPLAEPSFTRLVVELEPEQSLILSSEKVNVDDGADKSFSETTMQPITQPKAPTDLRLNRKKILPFSKPKSSYKVRVILPKKQVAKTQHAKELVATADATKSLGASKSAKEQVNQPKPVEAKKIIDEIDQKYKAAQETPEIPYDTKSEINIIKKFQPRQLDDDAQITFMGAEPSHFEYDQSKSIMHGASDSDSGLCLMPDDDLASLTGFETLDSADDDSKEDTAETFYAFVDMPAQPDPIGPLHEELCILNTKIDKLKSSITKKVTDDVQSFVPSIVANSLRKNLPGLLLEALKNTLPQLIKDSIKQSVSESIEEKLPVCVAHVQQSLQNQLLKILLNPMNKEFNALNTLESRRFVILQKELSKVIRTKRGKLVKAKVLKGISFVSDWLASVQSFIATNSQHVSDLRQAF
ncbi:retrovirus-related pol polyprotein from transposon TNT 1-94 [Tanacetum coccineum]